jgi:serine/threonine protein kinase
LRDVPVVEGFKVLDPVVLFAKIGQGGMGAVYRGRHCKLEVDVAVKCLMPWLAAENLGFIARFQREARLAARLAHQNVVHVLDVQQHENLHYLVMEFVRGESAADRVRRKGSLREAEALSLVLGACTGLAEAHAHGIVHRDIKPDNVLISLAGRTKLADLGLARATATGDGQSLARGVVSRVMGTPQYMPPEQWETPDVGKPADVWALGATLWFLLAGKPAFEPAQPLVLARRIQTEDFPSLRPLRRDVRPEVHDLLERCVRRTPSERFPDAAALLHALRALAHDDEASLADPEAKAAGDGAGVVTPPPPDTFLRIRAKLAATRQPGVPTQELRDGPRAASATAPTMPSPPATAATRPSAAVPPATPSVSTVQPAAEPPRSASPSAAPLPARQDRAATGDSERAAPGSPPAPTPPQERAMPEAKAPQPVRPYGAKAAAESTLTKRVTAKPSRRAAWLVVLLSLGALGWAILEFVHDRRVHPVEQPLFRPIDEIEAPPGPSKRSLEQDKK